MNSTELQCKTKESEISMDLNPGLLVKKAYAAGKKAVVIADKNSVRGFPDAYHVWWELLYKERGIVHNAELTDQVNGFMKIIYGIEACLVNDTDIPNDDPNRLKQIERRPGRYILIYVKNQAGLKDLYTLFTISNTEYRGVIPQSELEKRRSNLIIGSCGVCGDVNSAIAVGRTDEEIEKIADQIAYINIDNSTSHLPQVSGAREKLEKVCIERAHELYGPEIPVEVDRRFRHELDCIADNSFAGLFLINQMLTRHMHENGVIYGYRGCAGASLVAYLSGITWTNPLPAHYVCHICHYFDFDMSGIEGYHRGDLGADLPDRVCPICGKPLSKAGYDIPEESFLGGCFVKEPDFKYSIPVRYIDVLFEYAKTLPDISEVYRCGDGHYMAERHAWSADYHPGGAILVPNGVDINDYTPVEDTANGRSTHLEWYSICGLPKLEMYRDNRYDLLTYLKKETNTEPMSVPIDDEKVLSLLIGSEALNADLEISEAHSFSDFVRVTGYGYSSRKWDDVTENRIADGNYNKILPANREDVMLCLLDQGVERKDAYTIMEDVRKGRRLKPEQLDILKKHDLPDWYAEELDKIKYLFPKSHSTISALASYVERYYKLYYPEIYYKGWLKYIAADAEPLI